MLHKLTKKPDHIGPPIRCHLEHGEPEILEDLHEKKVQREPQSEFEVGL